MQISPDETIYWQSGFIVINATLVFTWVAMILLIGGSWLITRNLSTGRSITVRQACWSHS